MSLLLIAGASTGGSSGGNYALAGGSNTFPYTKSTSTNNIRNNIKARKISANTGFRTLRFTYCNWYVINGGELSGDFAFDLSMGVRDAAGVWHPGYCNGVRTVTLQPGDTVHFDVTISCAANDTILEVNRVVGPSGSVDYLVSHGSSAYRGDGLNQGTSSLIDMTIGGSGTNSIGFGATGTANLTTGGVSSVTINTGGSSYGSTATIAFLTKDANGINANYAASVAGGAVTSGFQNATGSAFTQVPFAKIVGGGYTASDTAIYAASIVSGEPTSTHVVSAAIISDSRDRGFGSTDALGNLTNFSYGVTERAYANAFGIINLGIVSNTASAYRNAHAKQYAAIKGNGVKLTHAFISLGINDITTGTSFTNLADYNKQLADEARSVWGAKVIFNTIEPCVNSGGTYTGDPTIGQTPSTGCGPGGVLATYNTAIRTSSDARLVGDVTYIDRAIVVADSVSSQYWKYNLGFPLTDDGIHANGWATGTAKTGTTYNLLSTTKGLDYIAANITVPTLTA